MKKLKQISLAGMILAASTVSMACTTEETASNNSDRDATAGICSGTTLQGSISNRRDVDWFSFEVTSAGTISVTLDHDSRDDFDWDLYPASGSSIASGSTSQIPETGSTSVSNAGTYYLKVSRYSGTGWYDLTINFPQGSGGDTGGGNTGGTDGCGYGAIPSKPSGLTEYVTGDINDVCPSGLIAGNGASLLMGGGSDVDNAFSQNVVNHIGSSMDTVVLRADDSNGYNSYLASLMASDSVITLVVDSRTLANSDYVEWLVKSAEFVFVAGGDQSAYLNAWENTKLSAALQHVYDKGGVIGGTSAGMAVMGSTMYDPDGILGAVSSEVVTNYCHSTLNFSQGMLSVPALANTVTDTHFYERDRMGRSMVFLARQATNHKVIAASEGTSLFVEADGNATVVGSYEIYVLYNGTSSNLQQGQCGSPVIYNNVNRVKLLSGQSINLNTLQHNGDEIEISIDGRNTQFYSPTSPY
ncbi:type 1 glutamine amidotransferase-like domain-containing protein [Bermanella marisrubri]|nr:Type 1 glutamine amidotransferase-like domain-containing protein [Bermanella marisrubri]QIZ83668.1 type 1 glutamine amidotransferase-like domain-containing protein [Bermanella marisrubri]